MQNLAEYFQYFDDDGNGSLSHAEFEDMVAHMKSSGIDVGCPLAAPADGGGQAFKTRGRRGTCRAH
jgi:hypothetical protein